MGRICKGLAGINYVIGKLQWLGWVLVGKLKREFYG